MYSAGAQALILAGVLSSLAAVAHLVCIALGGQAFRFMGAGERMASAIEAGRIRPIVVTLGIAAVLAGWAAYAFSGAGVIGELPLTKLVLPLVSAAFLARALGFPLLRPLFPENSNTFWLVSSGICLVIGALYAGGTAAVWARL
jgi:hypothetical protein